MMRKVIVLCWMVLTVGGGLMAQEKRDSLAQQDSLARMKQDSVVVKAGNKVVIIYDDGSTEVLDEREDRLAHSYSPQEEGDHLILGEVYEGPDRTEVRIGEKPILQVIDDDDTVVVRLGKKGVKIIETPDGSTIKVVRDDSWKKEQSKKRRKSFDGNWRGIEFGMNSYLDPDYKFPGGYMSVYDGKSWNINLNFVQYSFNFSRNGHFGLVTGLGIRLQKYRFANNNNIMKDSTGVIVEKPYDQNLKKSKLAVDYVTVPAIIEFHTRDYNSGFRIGVGVIGSLKYRSVTKVKWFEEGNKKKEKNKGDFNISPLDYALTVRLGVENFEVYANYSMVPLFKKDQGPEVYPLSVGLGIKF